MAELRLEDLGKTFGPSIRAVDEVSFRITSGEYLALLGPSGCGKSTLLRIIAGLERQTEGDIHIDGVNVNKLPPHRRDVALLFQRPAFILQQTVRQNLGPAWTARSPLRHFFGAGRQQEDELLRIANLLELSNDLERPVGQLSGGQQQRVALGRCLLRKAKVTLLDEPLGHLDAPLRVELRRQIRTLAREFGLTMIHVTHDPAEALAIGDRVAVMRQGRILQIDEPRKLRRLPSHRFAAELIHHEDGGFNWLAGEIVKEEFDTYFEGAFGRWPVSLQIVDHLRESLYKGDNFNARQGKVAIMMGIPAAGVHCTTSRTGEEADVRLPVKVCEIECSAAGIWVIGVFPQPLSQGERGERRWFGQADDAECFERGQEVTMTFSMNRAYWFDAATGRTLFAPTG
jgi:multiple sugar transport system ATP-binding protein